MQQQVRLHSLQLLLAIATQSLGYVLQGAELNMIYTYLPSPGLRVVERGFFVCHLSFTVPLQRWFGLRDDEFRKEPLETAHLQFPQRVRQLSADAKL